MAKNFWYDVAIKYTKTLESGRKKPATEHFLIDAMSFTEAEARMVKHATEYSFEDFDVVAIKRDSISDIFIDDTKTKHYRCKVNLLSIDEKTGAEKKTPIIIIIQANTSTEAEASLKDMMSSTMYDWETHTVSESNIIEIIKY